MDSLSVRIEFFGIPRQRAGVAALDVEAATLQDAVRALCEQAPGLRDCCTAEGQLRTSYIANLNGQRFVSDPNTPLVAGDTLLILSADAGG